MKPCTKTLTKAQQEINNLKEKLEQSLSKLSCYKDYQRCDFANSDEADIHQNRLETEQKYADLLIKEIKYHQKKVLSDKEKLLEKNKLKRELAEALSTISALTANQFTKKKVDKVHVGITSNK